MSYRFIWAEMATILMHIGEGIMSSRGPKDEEEEREK